MLPPDTAVPTAVLVTQFRPLRVVAAAVAARRRAHRLPAALLPRLRDLLDPPRPRLPVALVVVLQVAAHPPRVAVIWDPT